MIGLSDYMIEAVSSGKGRSHLFPSEIDIDGIIKFLENRGIQEFDKNKNLGGSGHAEDLAYRSRIDGVGYYRVVPENPDKESDVGIHFCNSSGTASFWCYVSPDNYFSLPQFRVETYKLDKRLKPRSKFTKECPKCGTKFSYTYEDKNFDKKRNEYFTMCPVCNHKMYLNFKPYNSDKLIWPDTYSEFVDLVEKYF